MAFSLLPLLLLVLLLVCLIKHGQPVVATWRLSGPAGLLAEASEKASMFGQAQTRLE